MISALEALQRLVDGNRRFASEGRREGVILTEVGHKGSVEDQQPFAAILGCSDSRVPAELVFNQGPGDLFVIRVAGNIVAASQVGSVEFAAERFGTRLVVVLGHSQCGAVTATLDQLQQPTSGLPRSLGTIVARIQPGVEPLLADAATTAPEDLLASAIRANVRCSVAQLRAGSELLQRLIQDDGLLVVGAEYSLRTRRVEFFDGVPEGP